MKNGLRQSATQQENDAILYSYLNYFLLHNIIFYTAAMSLPKIEPCSSLKGPFGS
jgi:hypothetical protein